MTEDDRLRALLEDAVSGVEPREALHDIRIRTGGNPMSSKRPWFFAAGGAVLATAATVVAVTVLADGPPAGTAGPAGTTASASPTPTDEPTSPSAEPTTSAPEPTPSQTPGGSTSNDPLPVYFVGDTPTGSRLFREFQPPSGDADLAVAAAQRAIDGQALDPDYGSRWPEGTRVGAVSVDRSTGPAIGVYLYHPTLDLQARPAGMSQQDAELAVQQLVHTVQAALQQRLPVSFGVGTSPDGGDRTTNLLGVTVSTPLRAGDPMTVQAPVWVISPQDGDTVGRTFDVEGRGAFFEANVSWQLLDGSRVVAEGNGTAQECCALSPYRFTVRNAPPGDYVLRVFDADMSGGEGPGEQQDTKRITIR